MAEVYSQNGWVARSDTSHFTRFNAAGRGWWAANDDVAVCFAEFLRRFNSEIEPVVRAGEEYDDWSYANRLVRGSSSVVSNHGSATAIDINSTIHPRGKANTFSAADRSTMRQIRNSITDDSGTPVLRLGMDYSSTVDDMHVEINASPTRVRQAANKIRNKEEEDPLAGITAEQIADAVWARTQGYTATDVASIGSGKAGDPAAMQTLLRYPPSIARLRRENAAAIGALQATVSALVQAINKGSVLTAAQITAASQAGADAALKALADRLDG